MDLAYLGVLFSVSGAVYEEDIRRGRYKDDVPGRYDIFPFRYTGAFFWCSSLLFFLATHSHLDFLPTGDKLFKLTSVRPVPDGFHPYYAHDPSSGFANPNAVTACAWTHIDELSNRTSVTHLKKWARSWNGQSIAVFIPVAMTVIELT